jgi:ACS family D-galactonate transporter-like MFS transporter
MTSATPEPATPDTRTVQPWHVLCGWLLIGWTVSAADRAITGPVVTWMINNDVSFMRDAPMPHALGGLIGGLFFAGYMLTQFPGGYLGDRYGHRTIIVISLLWAGVATLLNGVVTGLVVFIALRVLTGLGEGAFYSNDRSLISADVPAQRRGFAMGLVITGLALGITLATLLAPWMISLGASLDEDAWRMPFLLQGVVTLIAAGGVFWYFRRGQRALRFAKATLALLGYAAVGLAAVLGVYFLGIELGASELGIAGMEVALALALVLFVFRRKGAEIGPVLRNRSLVLVYLSYIAVLWNLWFFSFWSVAIVAGAAHSSFAKAALIAAFNAGAGILGFPVGGWLSDLGVRRGWGRKGMLLTFTLIQGMLTLAFGFYLMGADQPSPVVMGVLLFLASLFFNALQPIGHALTAELATERLRGSAFGMQNLIGEIGAVLSPAVGGYLRDATGSWTQAVLLDALLIFAAFGVLCFVREREDAGSAVAESTSAQSTSDT